ncbi:MAG TPA: hypothetical protein VMV94_01520 [Phycisphaerae bacterium]|nr:hypothetical protein [Phycisphaerae bacterium]
MPGGNGVKIAIVIVALGIAVTVFAVTSRREEVKIDEGAMKDLICTKCNAHIQMKLIDFDKAMKAAPKRDNPDAGSGPRTRRVAELPKLIKCPKCGEDAVTLAAKCPNSDKWYPLKNPDGSNGKCPD